MYMYEGFSVTHNLFQKSNLPTLHTQVIMYMYM